MFGLFSFNKHETENVFGVSNDIIHSYIERPEVDNKFTDSLDQNKQIIIYGSSKQGKTSLILKHLCRDNYVKIECSPNTKLIDIYSSILRQNGVNILSETEVQQSNGSETKGSAKASIQIPIVSSIETEAEYSKTYQKDKRSKYKTIEYNLLLAQSIIEILKAYKSRKYIVLENFHYLSEEEQRAFSYDLRIFQDENIPFIILGIWRERNRLSQYNGDLQDRLIEIPVEPWSTEDFKRVIKKGEKALNVKFDSIINKLIEASFDSIGVLQELAKSICLSNNITRTSKNTFVFTDEHLRRAIEIKRIDYSTRHLKSFESFIDNSYGAIKDQLYQVSSIEEKRKYSLYIPNYFIKILLNSSFDEIEKGLDRKIIHERIKAIHYRPDDVRSGDMTNFLHYIVNAQILRKITPPLFDYDTGARKLKIIDSTLYFFLKHSNRIEICTDLDI